MRFEQLHLLRYGKFTDRALSFPKAARDFHLIIGANEAGKSTTRSAILDLLYGIELRSTLDFLHAKADMRLGAHIEQQGRRLEFTRAKARIKTLFDGDGNVLPESALGPWLGGSDREFFDQMFGLDHGRLVAGGNLILDASNDLGQILFQSAAGVGSLGVVRDQLQAEADKLWSRRRANDRAWYIASDELARAEAALKAATVRTRDWVEARDRVLELQTRRDAARAGQRALEGERLRLERVRRVAPALQQWRQAQSGLGALAGNVALPPDAARLLAEGTLTLAAAERAQQLHAAQALTIGAKLAALPLAESLLAREADVLALGERRQQVRHHARDIERRQVEVEGHWQRAVSLARQLGWPADGEAALAARLPLLPARAALADLARRHALLVLARSTSLAARDEKAAELALMATQLNGLSVRSVPAALRAALAAARALGDLRASARRDAAALDKQARALASTLAAVQSMTPAREGQPVDAAWLRGVVLPTPPLLAQQLQQHGRLTQAIATLGEQQSALAGAIKVSALEVRQYRQAHQPVSDAELAAARDERDRQWQRIRAGDGTLHDLAPGFEQRLLAADQVADRRHDKAREVSELQSRLDALERLELQATALGEKQATQRAELAALDEAWARITAAIGLDGLARQDVDAWSAARDRALLADAAVAETRQLQMAAQAEADTAAEALRAALAEAGQPAEAGTPFDTLVVIAGDAVDAASDTRARLDQLTRQHEAATAALGRLADKATAAQSELDAWSAEWRQAAGLAGLPEATGVAAAEGALAVMSEIDEQLRAMREIRHARIDTMQRDLRDFAAEAGRLAASLAPELEPELAGKQADAIATVLGQRLGLALDDQKEVERLRKELARCEEHAAAAAAQIGRAQATLQPLMSLCHAASHEELGAAIEASDRRRVLEAAAATALRAVEEGGDGLPLPALEAEVAAVDALQAPLRLLEIAQELEAHRQHFETLTGELTQAEAALAAFAGQDAAARAEAERQDALAKMADAAERFIQVHTASRLLKWAIDRYRETRQGPMLSRAGAIFAALTLGSFQKLALDFDSEPLALHGQRPDGTLVAISGMSDGTRDQLYLALRLAALELHLDQAQAQAQGQGQGQALPFIADDLFINYDDRRARAGLEALATLSEKTQVIFLSHHDHLLPTVRQVFGPQVNVISL